MLFLVVFLVTYDMLGYNWGWLTYVFWIAVVFFVAGLTGNRFLTHILSVGAFLLVILAFELGLAEQTIYAYAAVPGLEDYSEISEYGIWYTLDQLYKEGKINEIERKNILKRFNISFSSQLDEEDIFKIIWRYINKNPEIRHKQLSELIHMALQK